MKDKLINYVELMNRYDENPGVSTQMLFRKQELMNIKDIQQEAENNIDLKKLIIDFQRLLPNERMSKLNDFLKKEELKTLKEDILKQNATVEEKQISLKYSIPVSSIEHCYLSDGTELYKFKGKDDSTTILKLEDSKNYHNTKILKQLHMVESNDLKNYIEKIDRMDPSNKKKFNFIINNRSIYNVKAINLDYAIYLNEKDELLEVMYDQSKQTISVRNTTEKYKKVQPERVMNTPKEEPALAIKSKSGFINAFLLFTLTGFTGGVLATILSLFLSKI